MLTITINVKKILINFISLIIFLNVFNLTRTYISSEVDWFTIALLTWTFNTIGFVFWWMYVPIKTYQFLGRKFGLIKQEA